jgi:excisionase family DNA binding protein
MMDAHEERRTVEVTVERAWLSYREAQAYAGIGRTKLWELVSRGDLQAAKVGRSVKISKQSLEEYLRSQNYREVNAK